MQPFLAMIMPVSGGYPDNTLPMPQPPQPPLGIWGPTDPRPSHPIAGVPPGGVPGQPGVPTHPIYNPPIAGWPGGLPGGGGFPGQGGPDRPPLGIWGPTDPRPTPPIYIPPEGSPPPLGIWGPPDMPPGFWGGGMGPGVKPQPEPPRPTHPIVLPPDLPPVDGENRPIEWKTAWTPTTGWVVIGIPAEGTLVPTPA